MNREEYMSIGKIIKVTGISVVIGLILLAAGFAGYVHFIWGDWCETGAVTADKEVVQVAEISPRKGEQRIKEYATVSEVRDKTGMTTYYNRERPACTLDDLQKFRQKRARKALGID